MLEKDGDGGEQAGEQLGASGVALEEHREDAADAIALCAPHLLGNRGRDALHDQREGVGLVEGRFLVEAGDDDAQQTRGCHFLLLFDDQRLDGCVRSLDASLRVCS